MVAVCKEYNVISALRDVTFNIFKAWRKRKRVQNQVTSLFSHFTKRYDCKGGFTNKLLHWVSMGIAVLIAKSGCPFTNGNLAKEWLLLATNKVCPKAKNKFKNMSLNRMIILRRI